MLARLALKVEGQRLALDRAKGKLMDVSTADGRMSGASFMGSQDAGIALLEVPPRVLRAAGHRR
jgi:hypothetical protein